jgi:hypothetical protein
VIDIQSHSNVITNSSSEVFMLSQPEDVIADIVKDIRETGKRNANNGTDRCSGMGGDLMVYTWENGFNVYKKWCKDPQATEEDWAAKVGVPLDRLKGTIVVDIDWARRGTVDYIKETYGGVGENSTDLPDWAYQFVDLDDFFDYEEKWYE